MKKQAKPSRLGVLGVIILTSVLAVLGAVVFGYTKNRGYSLQANRTSFHLSVADTPESRAKGLGGRENMAVDQGMIFVFSEPAMQCFWMKDMHFPIDIIWLDSDRKVVHIETDVSQESYPEKFCPQKLAKYVLELRAGQAKRSEIRQGQTLHF